MSDSGLAGVGRAQVEGAEVPVSHWVVADESTAPALARALWSASARGLAAYVSYLAVLTVVMTVMVSIFWSGDLAVVVAAVLVAGLLLMMLRVRRGTARVADQMAAPGSRLGVGFGPGALTVQTGSGVGSTPYPDISKARTHGGFLVLTVRRGRRLQLVMGPAHLFPPDFAARVAAGDVVPDQGGPDAADLGGGAPGAGGVASSSPDEPRRVTIDAPVSRWVVADASTAPALAQVLWGVSVRQARLRLMIQGVLVGAAVLLVLFGSVVGVALRGWRRGLPFVIVAVGVVLLVCFGFLRVRAQLRKQARAAADRVAPPGARLGVGFGPDEITLQTGAGVSLVPYAQIRRAEVRDGFMIATTKARGALVMPAHLFPSSFLTTYGQAPGR